MASSSITFASYALPTSSEWPLRMQAQMRTWLPVMAFAMVFAVESTPYLGADHTNAPLRRLAEILCGYGVDAHWASIHHLIRKTGHFMGYGVFSLICFRGFWITLRNAALQLPRQLRAHGWRFWSPSWWPARTSFTRAFCPTEPDSSAMCFWIVAERRCCVLCFFSGCRRLKACGRRGPGQVAALNQPMQE